MTIKAKYPDIGVEVNFLTESPVSLQAPTAGASYLTFKEDVTIIPMEGQKGEHTHFPAGEAIPLQDFGDCYIVLGEVEKGYIPTGEDSAPVEEDDDVKAKEEARLVLLEEAKGYGLNPHPLTGIPRLTDMIAAYKAKLEEEKPKDEEGSGEGSGEGSNPPANS